MNQYVSLSDFDIFLFYGEAGSDIDIETQSDILAGMTQPKRTMYYNGQEGAAVPTSENAPLSLVFQINVRMNIVNWISKRNTEVTDGTNGTLERRVAVSQNSVVIDYDKSGAVQMTCNYIPFKDVKTPKNVSLPIQANL